MKVKGDYLLLFKTVLFGVLLVYRTEVEHLAEMYFRAWNKASGTFLEEIESTCIQDFMQHGIQLYRNSPVLPKVRQVGEGTTLKCSP